jgi:hypothetical protein
MWAAVFLGLSPFSIRAADDSGGARETYTEIAAADPVILPVEYVRAITTVYPDFVARIQSGFEESDDEFDRFMSDPTNYRVFMHRTPAGHYFVSFRPQRFPGVVTHGGGVAYEVDANSYAIISVADD